MTKRLQRAWMPLRYRTQAPLLDALMKELGLDSAGVGISGLSGALASPAGEKQPF